MSNTRPSLRNRVRGFMTVMSGIKSVSNAFEAGYKPSRQATIDAGFNADAFDDVKGLR